MAILAGSGTVLQPVIPVLITSESDPKAKCTYTFFDQGSTGCFITEDLAEELQLVGSQALLQVKTMHGISCVNTTAISGLVVSDLKGVNSVKLPRTYTRPEIPVSPEQIPRPETLQRWPHLQEIAQ